MLRQTIVLSLLSSWFACTAPLFAAEQMIEADICVYGGTSGGVVAAVQAARLGKKAVLVEPGRHLGGMTSGGLSAVDIGDPRSVGGLAREYFTRLVKRYGKELAWDKPFVSKAGGPATGGAYSIEPHTAEAVFDEMVREAGITVVREAQLTKTVKNGARITELHTANGRVIRAKMFIDATYEGDLMGAAGVTYTVAREGNAKYGETYNGIYYDAKYRPRVGHLTPGPSGRVAGGQGVWDRDLPLDPFRVPGDPKSGLLPLINAGEPGTPGDPAPGIQAYCYRLCLTTAADRLPIAPPADYDAGRYEIVARFIAACQAMGDDVDLRWFSKYDALPNDKWDFNTATFGGNLPGENWEWPEAGHARRAEIAKQHENYHRGLLHFLATDERVPSRVRDEMRRFGLPRDEFPDTGGWPHQLYIREGRRMVSDLVLTEHHTFGRAKAAKPVSLGSYGTDTHEIRRIVKDGVVTREGKTAGGRDGAPPYGIGYEAIVPKAAECENLFVTFALSASHTAFSSIRMEPVFMASSQSAATAACHAIDDACPVQKVDYEKLRRRLLDDGQVLEWKSEAASKQ
ncbi:MAG: xanthan lyase [Pirellula sp.]|nr:xanthan lyase [Pirellula sp.]